MIVLILGALLVVILTVGSFYYVLRIRKDEIVPVLDSLMAASIVFVLGCIMFSLIIKTTTGILPNYSNGIRIGYIIKISNKGLIFKTNEGELQLGTGNQASLQEPFRFSVKDENTLKVIQNNIGNKVELTYNQWLKMPYRIGESSYEINSIKIIEEAKK